MIYFFNDINNEKFKDFECYTNLLPDRRKKRVYQFKTSVTKCTCIVAYLLFLYGYEKEYGFDDIPDFEIEENGKPYLTNKPEIHFNISHSDNGIVCIFSKQPVGIDLQTVRRISSSVINKVCSEKEIALINSSTSMEQEFCRIWTIKEAVSKLSGEGVFKNTSELNGDTVWVHTEMPDDNSYMTIASSDKTDITMISLSCEELYDFINKKTAK